MLQWAVFAFENDQKMGETNTDKKNEHLTGTIGNRTIAPRITASWTISPHSDNSTG